MNKIEMSTGNILGINESIKELIIDEDTEFNQVIFEEENFQLKIVIKSHVSLKIHSVSSIKNCNGIISISSGEGSSLLFHLGLKASLENHLKIVNEMDESYAQSEIKVRVAGYNNAKVSLTTTGILAKNIKDNIFLEDVKYFNDEDSYIECIPELFVESSEVVANHNVTIGGVTLEEMFYLESKGITKEVAKELLKESFIHSMKEEEGGALCI